MNKIMKNKLVRCSIIQRVLLITIIIMTINTLSSCTSTKSMRASNGKHYGKCPTYSNVKHYRKVSKKRNSKTCKFIN